MDEQKTPKADPSQPAHHPGTAKGEEKTSKEGKESGRHDTGTTGKAKRPAGKSTAESSTGVNPKDPVDPKSPHLPTP